MRYDLYAERDGAKPQLVREFVTLAEAEVTIETNWPEGHDAVAIPATEASRLAAGLRPELPAGSLIYVSDWEPAV